MLQAIVKTILQYSDHKNFKFEREVFPIHMFKRTRVNTSEKNYEPQTKNYYNHPTDLSWRNAKNNI